MANHVLFVAPYFTTGSSGQAKWEAAMTQAIGRVARYGQKKTVYIHEFVTANTIEADIWELRSENQITEYLDGVKHNNFGSSLREQIFEEGS